MEGRCEHTHMQRKTLFNAHVDCGVRYEIVLVLKKAGLLGLLSHSLPCPCTVTL